MSADGYIAKPNDDLSFLNPMQIPDEDYGYGAFMHDIDTVIIGRKTFDWVLTQVPEFPHKHLKTFVITRQNLPAYGLIEFYTGALPTLIHKLKNEEGKDIFVDGGAEIVNVLLKDKLIDELIISVIPILLGEGTRLFHTAYPEQPLVLQDVLKFKTGLVQLKYTIAN